MTTARQKRLVAFLDRLGALEARIRGTDTAEGLELIAGEGVLDSVFRENRRSQEILAHLLAMARRGGLSREAAATQGWFASDTDLVVDGSEKVSLMTLHAAKGLEFPVVFVLGCEDGLIPLVRSDGTPADIDEERRLFYVAMTRAGEQLFLMVARKRALYGRTGTRRRSPFVADIEERLRHHDRRVRAAAPPQPRSRQLSLFE